MSERIGIKPYIILIRPFTLIAPAVAMMCGMLMSLLYLGEPHRFLQGGPVILLSAVAMALAQMCGQVVNQAEDPVELDIMNGKSYRPVPRGLISQTQARKIGLAIGAVSLLLAFLIHRRLGIGIGVILFFAIFYSMEPVRAKRRPVLNVVWLGVSRGFLPLIIAWSVFDSPWQPVPLVLAGILFVWVAAFNITKDFPDMTGDRAFHIPTLPVLFGIERTKRLMQGMNVLALGILVAAVIAGVLRPSFLLAGILFLVSIPVIIKIDSQSRTFHSVENNTSWMFFYIGLGLLYVFFTLAMAVP